MRQGVTRLVSVLAILVLLFVSGCGGGKSAAPGPKTVKIAVAGPFSGPYSPVGLDALYAAEMAIEEFNAKQSADGLKIETLVTDTAADPKVGTTAIQKATDDASVMGMIGPMVTSVVDAALPILDEGKLPMITESATNPNLTEQGYPIIFRVTPRDDAQGPAAARFIVEELKAKKVYLVDDKGSYGQGLNDQVEKTLKDYGGIQMERGNYSDKDNDFSALLTKIKQWDPDVIYAPIPAPAHGALFVKQAKELGLRAQIMHGEAMNDPDYIEGSAGTAEGIYMTNIGPVLDEVPEAKAFLEKFRAKHGSNSVFTGQAYDATNIMLAAIEKAYNSGNLTRDEVLKNLKATSYRGVLGIDISFNEKGDLTKGGIYLLQVKGKEIVQVKQLVI